MAGKARQFKVEFVAKALGWDKATGAAKKSVQSVATEADKASAKVSRAQQVMERAVAGSATKIEAARLRQADAAAKVEIAERKVIEASKRYGGASSQVAAADQKLTQAMRQNAAAKAAVTRASSVAESAQARLAQATAQAKDEAAKANTTWAKMKTRIDAVDTTRLHAGLGKLKASLADVARQGLIAAGAAGAALAAGLVKSVNAAGRAEQSVGGVQSVFKKASKTIIDQSKKAADAFGLSQTAYQEYATTIGAILKNKGVKDFTGWTVKLVDLGGDLAATYGGEAADAVDALGAALRGEADPIEKYGVSLNETAVNAILAANGQDKLTGSALELAKEQARLKIIMQQTADAQGQAAREHDTYSASVDRIKAKASDAAAEIGKTLLPTAEKLLTEVVEPQIPKLEDWGKKFGSGFSEFMDGMTASQDDRDKLTENLSSWESNGRLAADALNGIADATERINSITGAGDTSQPKSWTFGQQSGGWQWQGPNLGNWPKGNKLTWSEQKDWNRQWEEQYKNNHPTLGSDRSFREVLDQWNQDWIDWGHAQDEQMASWFDGKKQEWSNFWATVGSGFKGTWDQIASDFSYRLEQIGQGASGWFADQNAKTQSALDGLRAIWSRFTGGVGGAFRGMWTSIGTGLDSFAQSTKTKMNDFLGWINTHLIGGVNKVASRFGLGSDKDPWIKPIPMADGGVTRDPQIRDRPVLWAEAGREAYIPLGPEKRQRSLALWRQVGRELGATMLANGRVFPLPAGTYTQTQGLHGVDGGYDYAAPFGTSVMANQATSVVQAADLGSSSYGKYVRLSNGSVYAHLSKILVKVGQLVSAGQQIGAVGWSGNVRPPGPAGTHLHYVPGGALGAVVSSALNIAQMVRDQLGNISGDGLAAASGMGQWGKVIGRIPGKLADAAVTKLKDQLASRYDAVTSTVETAATAPLKAIARAMLASRGWGDQWTQFNALVQGESSWNPFARNASSGAYGLPQALPGSKMASAGWDWRWNGATQLRWMMDYIASRYETPARAYAQWLFRNPHWYDEGGWLSPGVTVARNDTGRDEAILTGQQWETAAAAIRWARTAGQDSVHMSRQSWSDEDLRALERAFRRSIRAEAVALVSTTPDNSLMGAML